MTTNGYCTNGANMWSAPETTTNGANMWSAPETTTNGANMWSTPITATAEKVTTPARKSSLSPYLQHLVDRAIRNNKEVLNKLAEDD